MKRFLPVFKLRAASEPTSPRIWSDSAQINKSVNPCCVTNTSPLYMKSIRAWICHNLTSLGKIITGCCVGFSANILSKKDEQAAKVAYISYSSLFHNPNITYQERGDDNEERFLRKPRNSLQISDDLTNVEMLLQDCPNGNSILHKTPGFFYYFLVSLPWSNANTN